jgi:hypothetical protein
MLENVRELNKLGFKVVFRSNPDGWVSINLEKAGAAYSNKNKLAKCFQGYEIDEVTACALAYAKSCD